MLINAVFQEPDDHSQNSTRREASKALQNPLRDEVGVVLDLARCVDHSPDDGLKKTSANRASHRAGDGMSKRSEAVFLHDDRGNMPAENSGDDLN